MVIRKEDAVFKARPSPDRWKKRSVEGNWDIVNKNGHSTFHSGKPENFNSLREKICLILWHCLKMRVSAKKKCCGY